MARWFLSIAIIGFAAVLVLGGLVSLTTTPVSSCSELDDYSVIPGLPAFLTLALIIWVLPLRSVRAWQAATCMLLLGLAAVAAFKPLEMKQHERDVLSCVGERR